MDRKLDLAFDGTEHLDEAVMPKTFTRTCRVGYSEVNANGVMDPLHYARHIIDVAYEWGELLGLGDRMSEELGLYWVIRETEIEFFGPLHFMDEFDFTIWLLNWKRVRGTRAFEVKRKDTGVLVAHGVQQIACLDSRTQRLVSPPMDLLTNFLQDAPQEIPSHRFPKIPPAPENPFTLQVQAAWQDVDILEMVNNAVYIGYAEEAAVQLLAACGWSPFELKNQGLALEIRRAHIQYQTPAVWGDTLNLTLSSLALGSMGGSFIVRIERASDGEVITSCVLDWGLIDRGGTEARPLPEALKSALAKSLPE